MRFSVIDADNTMHRAKHAFAAHSSPDDLLDGESTGKQMVNMIMHMIFSTMSSAAERFRTDHTVVAFDSYSWRRELYPEYKAQRRTRPVTPSEEQADAILRSAIDDLKEFLIERTNVTVLHQYMVEADDFIARWVQVHDREEFHHTIVSTDKDFRQLVRAGVDLFMPLNQTLVRDNGIFFQDGKPSGKNTRREFIYGDSWKVKVDAEGNPERFDPKWDLFEKCIRGDPSDNIPSAWPRVRKAAMIKAFYAEDPVEWNNFIHSTWGPDGENSVNQRYEFNRSLIDLSAQPEVIKEIMDKAILDSVDRPRRSQVGTHFQRFCGKYGMNQLLTRAARISKVLSAGY